MQKKLLFILSLTIAVLQVNAQQHRLKIILDTKKFPNNLTCNLNSPGFGQPSPLTKVYLHSGACWYNWTVGPSSINNLGAKNFCFTQIIPLNSLVWQSVVGNWGANPQDDSVGIMTTEPNGIFTKEFIVEQYYSAGDAAGPVSLDPNNNGTITSMPMNTSAEVYTIGLVFRDATGTISGRDSTCNDIFIIDINTSPKIIQSGDPTYTPWTNGPITFEYNQVGIEDNQIFYTKEVYPNPTNTELNVSFNLVASQSDFEMNVFDALGNKVRNLYRGKLPIGKQIAHWDLQNDNGDRVSQGIYYFTMRSGNNIVTDKFVVTQ